MTPSTTHPVRAPASILLSTTLLLTGVGMLNTLVAYRLEAGGSLAATIGLVQGAYFVALMLGARYSDRVVRRVGHIRSYAAFAAGLTAIALGHGLSDHPAAWLALRAGAGFLVGGLYLVTESWLGEISTNEDRARLLGLYVLTSQLGLTAGQVAFGVSQPETLEPFVLLGGIIALALVPVALTATAQPPPPQIEALPLTRLYRLSPVGFVTCGLSGILLGALFGIAPLYGTRLGLERDAIATLMAVVMLGGVALPWPVGWLADRFDRTNVLAAVTLGLIATAMGLSAAGPDPYGTLLALAFVFGGLSFVVYPLGVAQANDYVAPGSRLAASGALLVAYGLGAAVGPTLGGAAITARGPGGLFELLGGIAVLFLGFVAVRRVKRKPLPSDEQEPFVAVPRTTAEAILLDARADEEVAG